jgi:hypothetical protein
MDQPGGKMVPYQTPDGEVRVDVRLEQETVWLIQQQMAALFSLERSVVAKHIGNAYREGELSPAATCAKFAQVQTEGSRTVSREVDRYNLKILVSAVQFRPWPPFLRRLVRSGCRNRIAGATPKGRRALAQS